MPGVRVVQLGVARRVMDGEAPTGVSPAALLLIAAVAVACYASSLGHALVFDDLNAITNNGAVRRLDLARLFMTAAWFERPVGVYRPITTLTFALDHAAHGVAPLGYHLVNVVLHAAVSV